MTHSSDIENWCGDCTSYHRNQSMKGYCKMYGCDVDDLQPACQYFDTIFKRTLEPFFE